MKSLSRRMPRCSCNHKAVFACHLAIVRQKDHGEIQNSHRRYQFDDHWEQSVPNSCHTGFLLVQSSNCRFYQPRSIHNSTQGPILTSCGLFWNNSCSLCSFAEFLHMTGLINL